MTGVLTDAEHAAVKALGDVWHDLCHIIGSGPTRAHDLAEVIVHIHALQHFVMAQAAARAYPSRYRLAGDTVSRNAADPLAADQVLPTLVVLAGNVREADQWCRDNAVHPRGRGRRVLIVGRVHTLRGLSGPVEVARVGSWRDRSDLRAIEDHLLIVNATSPAAALPVAVTPPAQHPETS